MRPIQADKMIRLEHRVYDGASGSDMVYLTTLYGVSCREVHGASPTSSGFSDHSTTQLSIFPGHTLVTPSGATGAAYPAEDRLVSPEAFNATEAALRGSWWTMAPEDKVELPSGLTGKITRIEDNTAGRCAHWFVEVG